MLKTWLFFVGIVVFRLMSLVKTPPKVSMPKLSGVTSKSKMSYKNASTNASLLACCLRKPPRYRSLLFESRCTYMACYFA